MNEDEEHDVIHNLIKPKLKALKIQVTIPLSATVSERFMHSQINDFRVERMTRNLNIIDSPINSSSLFL
jgi:hypothetical protein